MTISDNEKDVYMYATIGGLLVGFVVLFFIIKTGVQQKQEGFSEIIGAIESLEALTAL